MSMVPRSVSSPAAAVPPSDRLWQSARSPRTRNQFEAYAAVMQAAEELQRQAVELLKGTDLSAAQYNVLRILRGAFQ